MGCMKMKPNTGICPYCHFDLEQYQRENAQKGLHYLQPGSILNGRYMIGKVLGEGGFGITYIGWNLNLDMPIAIKEYFPNGFVTRNANQTNNVTVLSGGGKGQFYLKQKDRFLDEAKTLGKLNDIDAIVSIKDCFAENGTAYIVMEYLDGEDFGSFLKKNGGKLPARQVFEMMEPIIKALAFIHKNNHGLIHRDISPDNIRIMKNSKVKLMDFGAARETDDEKSLSVVLKPGYAPEEQYRTRGKQGPWTDVYGLCATMYRAIVGKKPIESLERIAEDNLKKPSELGIIMNPKQEAALMKGLAVLAKNRWQSMDELYEAFYTAKADSTKQKGAYKKSKQSNYGGQQTKEEKASQEGRKEDGTQIVVVINPGYESAWENTGWVKPSSFEGKFVKVPEYEINLSAALMLRKELQKRGYKVVMTRKPSGVVKSMQERVRRAEELKADLFLTLHCGNASDSNFGGARALIAKKNDGNEENRFYKFSSRLAMIILDEYCKATGMNKRIIAESNLIENKSNKMPSIILELGCLGNMQDEMYMIKEENQEKMAKGIADGIKNYKRLLKEMKSRTDSKKKNDSAKQQDKKQNTSSSYVQNQEENGQASEKQAGGANQQVSGTQANRASQRTRGTKTDTSNQQINGVQYRKQYETKENSKTRDGIIAIVAIVVFGYLFWAINEYNKEPEVIQPTGIIAINPGYELQGDDETEEKSYLVGKYSELPEYKLNLQVAQKLKEELEERGHTVIMTREDNDAAKVKNKKERIKQAVEAGAEILVTLHAETEEICGSNCNDPYPKGYITNDENCELYPKSIDLSYYIMKEYCNATGFGSNGYNWRYIYEDKLETDCTNLGIPTVSLNMGHMDDGYYDEYMSNENNQETMADGIANGIDTYFMKYGN